ncbi:MAG: hypothetical protein Q9227_007808 [Pyrenula ochraceoflavens]
MSVCSKLFLLFVLTWLCLFQTGFAQAAASWPVQSFKTEPLARPPVIEVSKSGAPLATGYLMITQLPVTNEVANAAFIMTDTGDLIWYSPPGEYANLIVQSLDSMPVLSFWNGTSIGEQGYGYVSIMDTTYTEIYRVCPQIEILTPGNTEFPCYADIHESAITERGSLLLTVYNITTADLSSIGGPKDGWVYDGLFYEVDIKTNKTLFQWKALESGIPLSASKALLGQAAFGNGTLDSPFDWFHINSVQLVGSDYLINSRHTWASYLLTSSGDIKWQFDGDTGGNFTLPQSGSFSWQHHARLQDVTSTGAILHYFNNANGNAPLFNGTHPAEGLEFRLDFGNRTASLLKNLIDANELIYPIAAGSYSPLSNGNTILGYGTYPSIKEFGPDGDVRMSIRYGLNDTASPAGFSTLFYRAFRQDWNGTPATPPVATLDRNTSRLYMSWNGATGITSWKIFCGNFTQQNSTTSTIISSTGFETAFNLTGSSCRDFIQADAYRGGTRLSSTNIVTLAGS